MLALRPNCECCDIDLPPDSTKAKICTYECTFCVGCVEGVLKNVCPNCGGGFESRPIRPKIEHRSGVSIANDPASTKRIITHYSREQLSEFCNSVKDISPENR